MYKLISKELNDSNIINPIRIIEIETTLCNNKIENLGEN